MDWGTGTWQTSGEARKEEDKGVIYGESGKLEGHLNISMKT